MPKKHKNSSIIESPMIHIDDESQIVDLILDRTTENGDSYREDMAI